MMDVDGQAIRGCPQRQLFRGPAPLSSRYKWLTSHFSINQSTSRGTSAPTCHPDTRGGAVKNPSLLKSELVLVSELRRWERFHGVKYSEGKRRLILPRWSMTVFLCRPSSGRDEGVAPADGGSKCRTMVLEVRRSTRRERSHQSHGKQG